MNIARDRCVSVIVVLDASSILSGGLTDLTGLEAFITPEVVEEVSKGRPKALLDNLISAGLTVRGARNTDDAAAAAASTGDLDHLSFADLSVIALAMEIGGIVITDDFRVQNVLHAAGLAYRHAGEIGDRTISSAWRWRYRCKGCGRYYEKGSDDCPICGSELRSVRSKG